MSLTIQDFKNQFPSDFLYLPVWSENAVYNIGQKVYYNPTALFYICLNNNVTSLPTNQSDWSVDSSNIADYITDGQLTAALNFTMAWFPFDIAWGAKSNIAFLYLMAHLLIVQNPKRAGGLQSANLSNAIQSSKSLADMSVSYTIPEWQLKNPQATWYNSTSYGALYYQMLCPYLIGNVMAIYTGVNA